MPQQAVDINKVTIMVKAQISLVLPSFYIIQDLSFLQIPLCVSGGPQGESLLCSWTNGFLCFTEHHFPVRCQTAVLPHCPARNLHRVTSAS